MDADGYGSDDDEFSLPSEVRALKEEVLSGRTWSMNLELPDTPTPPDSTRISPRVNQRKVFSTGLMISSSAMASRRLMLRAPSTHRDLLFLLAFIVHWVILVFIYETSGRSRMSGVWALDYATWASLLNLSTIVGSALGALV
jgi:hypothetical protein